ncbi:MAG: hypothetical protein ACI9Z9_002936 [Litorivivens sp.]|jgi:hypothetical protein
MLGISAPSVDSAQVGRVAYWDDLIPFTELQDLILLFYFYQSEAHLYVLARDLRIPSLHGT